MTADEIRLQAQNDAAELRVMAAAYPQGSSIRFAFIGFATTIAEEYLLSDAAKIDLVLQALERIQPCTKAELAEQLDFSRDEARRLIEQALKSGMVDQFQQQTNGRPRMVLRIP